MSASGGTFTLTHSSFVGGFTVGVGAGGSVGSVGRGGSGVGAGGWLLAEGAGVEPPLGLGAAGGNGCGLNVGVGSSGAGFDGEGSGAERVAVADGPGVCVADGGEVGVGGWPLVALSPLVMSTAATMPVVAVAAATV